MKNNNDNNLLQFCIYYKGQKECPYEVTDPRYTAWRIERIWIRSYDDDKSDYVQNCITDYIRHGLDRYRMTDGVPLALKAVLMNRYFQYADREVIDDFKAFYEKLY